MRNATVFVVGAVWMISALYDLLTGDIHGANINMIGVLVVGLYLDK